MSKSSAVLMTFQTIPGLVADLPQIAALGFDGLMPYDNGNINTSALWIQVMDALQKHGLMCYVDMQPFVAHNTLDAPAQTAMAARINALKGHPALAGWYAFDEPTSTAVPAGQLQTAYSIFKANDTHPVYGLMPGYGPNFWPGTSPTPAYFGPDTQDVFGVDTYPIDDPGGFREDEYRTWLQGSFNATPASLTERVITMQAHAQANGAPVPTAANLIRLAEIAVETRWCTRGVWMWLWQWEDSVSRAAQVPGWTMLKEMIAANPTIADAVRTINKQHRYKSRKAIGSATVRLRAGSGLLTA